MDRITKLLIRILKILDVMRRDLADGLAIFKRIEKRLDTLEIKVSSDGHR